MKKSFIKETIAWKVFSKKCRTVLGLECGTKEWFEKQFRNKGKRSFDGDEWGHRWRASQIIRHKKCVEILKEYIEAEEEFDFWDTSCGMGEFAKYLEYDFPRANINVSDLSKNAIKYIKRNYPNYNSKISALPNCPFIWRSMDVVVCLETLYYFDTEQKVKIIDNIKNILRNDGFFLVSGCVNAGEGYFDEKAILQLLESKFDIVKVNYLYNYLQNKYEREYIQIIKNNRSKRHSNKQEVLDALQCVSDVEHAWLMNEKSKDLGDMAKTHMIVLCRNRD